MRQDCTCHSFLPRVVVVDVMHIICECTNDETKKDDDEMIPSINRRRRGRCRISLSLSVLARSEKEEANGRPTDDYVVVARVAIVSLRPLFLSLSRDPNSLIEEHNNKEVGGWEEGKESEKISPGKNETFTRNPEQNKSTIKSHMRHSDISGNADLTRK